MHLAVNDCIKASLVSLKRRAQDFLKTGHVLHIPSFVWIRFSRSTLPDDVMTAGIVWKLFLNWLSRSWASLGILLTQCSPLRDSYNFLQDLANLDIYTRLQELPSSSPCHPSRSNSSSLQSNKTFHKKQLRHLESHCQHRRQAHTQNRGEINQLLIHVHTDSDDRTGVKCGAYMDGKMKGMYQSLCWLHWYAVSSR